MMIFKGRNRVTSGFRLAARPEHNGIDLGGDDDKTVHAVAGARWALRVPWPKARVA